MKLYFVRTYDRFGQRNVTHWENENEALKELLACKNAKLIDGRVRYTEVTWGITSGSYLVKGRDYAIA